MDGSLKDMLAKVHEKKIQGQASKSDEKRTIVNGQPSSISEDIINYDSDLPELINKIRALKVSGETKMLIRFDDNHINLLKRFKTTLDFDVTQFVNFLCQDFLDNTPELRTLMKNSLKNSLKDL